MPISYPIALPMYAPSGGLSPRSIRVSKKTAISQSQSPSSFVAQTYVWSGQLWTLGISWPPALRNKAEPLVAGLSSLNGMEGSVLLPISSNLLPQAGSPALGTLGKVNGGSQSGVDLVTDGWPASVKVLSAGDWVQLGGQNLLLWSEEFANATGGTTVAKSPWAANNLTLDEDAYFSPINTLTACGAQVTSGSDSYLTQTFAALGAFEHTFSIWLRKLPASSQTTLKLIAIDSASGTFLGTAILNLTTSWQRFSLPFLARGTGNCTMVIGGGGSWTTAGTGSGVALWGAQVNPTAYPQTYRPTTSAVYNQPYQLHKVLTNVWSDVSGNATMSLWPKLRTSPADNAPITYEYPVGKFMLVSGDNWDIDTARFYGLDATFMVDLRG